MYPSTTGPTPSEDVGDNTTASLSFGPVVEAAIATGRLEGGIEGTDGRTIEPSQKPQVVASSEASWRWTRR